MNYYDTSGDHYKMVSPHFYIQPVEIKDAQQAEKILSSIELK